MKGAYGWCKYDIEFTAIIASVADTIPSTINADDNHLQHHVDYDEEIKFSLARECFTLWIDIKC